MTKLYWRERDANPTPCAFRYSKNCSSGATHEKVHQLIYIRLFDRRGLSWLNLEDVIPVCRTHMEDDKDYVRRYGMPDRTLPLHGAQTVSKADYASSKSA